MLRFDGKVAVVTGAARGLGRAYAELLAARGARVVVNDTGGRADGSGGDGDAAAAVVEAIRRAGGEAVVSTHSVAEPASARGIVDCALESFGGLDIVVNNAAILEAEDFTTVSVEQFLKVVNVSLTGSFLVTQAAWPALIAAGTGRVVMTTSAAAFGSTASVAYAAAKGGVISLARSLAQQGQPDGIKVNAISPGAETRLVGRRDQSPKIGVDAPAGYDHAGRASPEDVAPLVAVLAHESCPVSGETLASSGVHFSRVLMAVTAGAIRPGASPEQIADDWSTLFADRELSMPSSAADLQTLRVRAIRAWANAQNDDPATDEVPHEQR